MSIDVLNNGTAFRIIETMLAAPDAVSTSIGIRIYANGDASTPLKSRNSLGKSANVGPIVPSNLRALRRRVLDSLTAHT
jgi:hypothetical protein